MRGVLPRSVFSTAEGDYDWSHVVLAGHLWSEWMPLADEAGEALACVRDHGEPATEPVQAAASDFRYEYGLLAADEMEAWLARWQLTVDDWMAFLRRHVARRACKIAEHGVAAVSPDQLWAEAVCTSTHEDLARRLAGITAIGAGSDEGEGPPAQWDSVEGLASAFGGWDALGLSPETAELELERLARLDARFRKFESSAVADEAIEREIGSRKLDWTIYECDVVELDTLDAAREAALCLRLDGLPIEEVATRAGVALDRASLALGEVGADLATVLLAAQPGSVIGPIPARDRFLVASVRAKEVPKPDDALARAKATRKLLERMIDAEVQAQVRWREHI